MPASTARARSLRRRAPTTERFVWSLLRDRKLDGLKFRRQVPLGPFVADFVCLEHKLVVEADGPMHDPNRDLERDAWLESRGFRVVRFKNDEIKDRPHELFAEILRAIGREPPHPTRFAGHLLPRGEKD